MSQSRMSPVVQGFFDPATNTVSYVVKDPGSQSCAIVDPVLDYDPKSGRTKTQSASQIVEHVGEHIAKVQEIFKSVFNIEKEFLPDGSQFDHLFADGETFSIGGLQVEAIHTPGHTPACMTYVMGDAAFVGDTLFMPDFGTARADFPGGDTGILYKSIQKVLALPDDTRLFMCHDYKAPGRDEFAWETTVAEERAGNIHVGAGKSEDEFVAMRTARDATLEMPTLLLPSVQVNIRAGALPPAEDNGVSYLKIPLNAL